MEKLKLVVSLERDDGAQMASARQVDDGTWLVGTYYPVPREELVRMLVAAGGLVPMPNAATDAATHARVAELKRWHNEDVASLCALQKEVETLGGRLKGTETACEVLRSERDELRKEVKDLQGALEMERAGAASLLSEAGAQPGETLRKVVLRLKRQRDEAKQACDVATAQNERIRSSCANLGLALEEAQRERDEARKEVERRDVELVKLSDALNEEHDKRRDAEATIARIRNRCTQPMSSLLESDHASHPLELVRLDWELECGVGRVVLRKREA